MSAHSPDFVGARLRQAREVRGITGTSLAERLGVSPTTLTHYEHGRHTPPPDRLAQIVELLDFKPEFFLRPVPDAGPTQVSFTRSIAASTRATMRRAEHRRVWMHEVIEYLAAHLPLPEPNIPGPGDDFEWRTASDDDIERLAGEVRTHWGLSGGPISNVTLLAEKNGVIAGRYPFGRMSLDAFSLWDAVDGRPYLVLGDDGQSAVRTRFNVCHEIGHLVMHRNVTPEELANKNHHKRIEAQAHRFAGAFLVPAPAFRRDVRTPTLDGFRLLKPRWKASVAMMIVRARDLGLVDADYTSRLFINLNRRGWNTTEPYDQEFPVEVPVMMRRAFEALTERNIVTPSQVRAELPFNQDELEMLCGLPSGYLDEPGPDDVWGFLDGLTSDFPART